MNAVGNSGGEFPYLIEDGKLHFRSNGCYFIQNKALKLNNTVNIYIVDRLNLISSTRNTDYTIQNALFGAMKITKSTDYSKTNYTGYGLYFDERGTFGHTIKESNFDHTANARNVLIFGADMSFSVHALIEQIVFTLWARNLFRELMILQYTQKKTFIEILQTQVKHLY